MLKVLSFIMFIQVLFFVNSCSLESSKINDNKVGHYIFEGDEPFWSLEIENNSFVFFLNEEIQGKVNFSNISSRGKTFGFSGDKIYGVINKNWNGYCDYAITEKDSLSFEVIFVYNSETYKGCGELVTN